MRRRSLLAGVGFALSATFAGCLGNAGSNGGDANADTGDENDGGADIENRAEECEKEHIRREVVTRDDETITDSLQPTVIDTESRDDGELVELRTEFGVTRESEEEPDEHLDYLVTASYLFTDDTVYRTEGEEAEGDPRNGITMNC